MELSIIIPTRNRATVLKATLDALSSQAIAPGCFEVIVVADGCTDTTDEMVRGYTAPFRLTLVNKNPATGPGAAINMGVGRAIGEILMFLDDDMEASPQLVSEHLAVHRREPGGVVTGYFPMQSEEPTDDWFTKATRLWWAECFAARDKPHYQYTFRDFCGNVSLPSVVFRDLGGFDEEFDWRAAGEDYELGYRLIARGVRFQFARRAASIHQSRVSLDLTLRRAEQEGYGQSLIVRKHPELFAEFLISKLYYSYHQSQVTRCFMRAAWTWPAAAAAVAASVKTYVAALVRGERAVQQSRLLRLLRVYYYWKGVRSQFGSLQVWEAFVRETAARVQ